MKRFQTLFVILLVIGGLALWLLDVVPLVAQHKGSQTSRSRVTQQEGRTTIVSASPKETKVMREYRGIKLGMKRDELLDALGKPELSGKGQDTFKIGGDDQLTAHYDNDGVKVIQLYFFESKQVPNWTDVVGDTEIKQRQDGSKFARVEVTEEKFWVSMFQGKSGDVTTITISRSVN
jgi:hypothetical protein